MTVVILDVAFVCLVDRLDVLKVEVVLAVSLDDDDDDDECVVDDLINVILVVDKVSEEEVFVLACKLDDVLDDLIVEVVVVFSVAVTGHQVVYSVIIFSTVAVDVLKT